MSATHYEILGIKSDATQSEVKSAYRRLVLEHHPDRSKNPKSTEIFRRATDAYEVLSDLERRKSYDETLRRVSEYRAEQHRTQQVKHAAPRTAGFGHEMPKVTPEVTRLTSLYARGRLAEAESLARQIRMTDPRQPIPYAVLGDIARSRGNLNEAAKLYAYAAQYDPLNTTYQRRYEQLLNSTTVIEDRMSSRLQARRERIAAPLIGLGLVLVAAGYVAFSGDEPAFHSLALISSWSASLLFMLFFGGLSIGSSLAIGNFLDRFSSVSTTAVGKVGPAVVLGAVALVNFWAATLLYAFLGVAQRAFDFSTTRLVGGVVVTVLLMTVAAMIARDIKAAQVLLWGGNVAYLGALVGWMVADAFRS